MNKNPELPESIAIFPLPGALLLPRAHLPLHLFEPRYLAMLEDCLKTPARLIGMIQPHSNPNGNAGLSAIGCAGRVTSFSETDDGRYLITLTGISRFRILNEVDGFTPYRRAHVAWDSFARDMGLEEQDHRFDRDRFLALLTRYFQAQEMDGDWSGINDADPELLINSLSMLLPLTPSDKQALLEAPSLETRRETLVTLMEYTLAKNGNPSEALQ